MELRGDIVKDMRLSNNWTQQHLAEICDVSLRTIQRVENKGTASLETVMALCVTFNTQRETFFEVPRPGKEELEKVTKSPFPYLIYVFGLLSGVILSGAISVFSG